MIFNIACAPLVERMSPRLLHRLLLHSLLRVPESLPRRCERLTGFPVGRSDLRIGRGASGAARVVGRRVLVDIPEQISRDVGKGNRGGDRRQQET